MNHFGRVLPSGTLSSGGSHKLDQDVWIVMKRV
jgi:hypothetical protein